MLINHYLSACALAVLPLLGAAQAQPVTDPADAKAVAGSVRYESAFEGYRSMAEEVDAPHLGWRAANDEVGRIGGHAGYMRSATAGNRAIRQPQENRAAQNDTASDSGHSGHH